MRRSVVDQTPVDLEQNLLRVLRRHAEDESIRPQRVLDRLALPQEFRIPRDLETVLGRQVGEVSAQPLRRTHRHGGLADDQTLEVGVHRNGLHRAVDIPDVGGVRVRLLRRADADEVHRCAGRRLHGRICEAQSPRFEHLGEQILQARLVERWTAGGQRRDLRFIGVVSNDVVAEVSHARRVYSPQIPRTEDTDSHVPLHSRHALPRLLSTSIV